MSILGTDDGIESRWGWEFGLDRRGAFQESLVKDPVLFSAETHAKNIAYCRWWEGRIHRIIGHVEC